MTWAEDALSVDDQAHQRGKGADALRTSEDAIAPPGHGTRLRQGSEAVGLDAVSPGHKICGRAGSASEGVGQVSEAAGAVR